MAAFTAIGQALVHRAEQRWRNKTERGIVTDTALALCRDMVGCLACRDTCVMAGRAVVGIDALVVEGDAGKAAEVAGRVTGRAIQSRRHMVQRLPNSDIAVMALRAIAGIDTRVAKRRRNKAGGGVTIGAILVIGVGRYVIWQFADTDHIVVARRAVVGDAGVIIGARAEGAR